MLAGSAPVKDAKAAVDAAAAIPLPLAAAVLPGPLDNEPRPDSDDKDESGANDMAAAACS